GGDFQTSSGDSALNTPEFAAAVDYYGKMLHDFAPEGIHNMSWQQIFPVYNQGKLAMFSDASSLYAGALDPAQGPYADRTGVAVFPAGPVAHKTYDITAWGLAISHQSTKKDLAWKLVSFLTNKKNTIFLQGEGMSQGARASAWQDPEGVKKFPPDWVAAVKASGPIGVGHDRPQVTAVSEARDIIGEAIAVSIGGRDFKPALAEAHRRFQEIIDREKER
ncbi:MAG: extracellular solute-binding protein, partial [Planctomycetes bacterium]|nr:extracellular solute-binding protein [Planctomycetota bacterium]